MPKVPVRMSTRPWTPQNSGGTTALVPHEAHGVAVVHHHQGVKLIGQIADPLEVGDVAVHGEHAVGSDELHLAAGGLGVLQAPAQVRHVVVLVAVALGLAQPHAVDDGRVVQLVGDHRVLGPQQGLEETAVGVEAGGVEDGVVHAQKLRQLPSSSLWMAWVPQINRTELRPKPHRS